MLHVGEQLISALKNKQTGSLWSGGAGSSVAGGRIAVNHHVGLKRCREALTPAPLCRQSMAPRHWRPRVAHGAGGWLKAVGTPRSRLLSALKGDPSPGQPRTALLLSGGSQTRRAPGIPLEAPCTRIKPTGRADYPAGTRCLRVREQLP